MPNRFTLTCPAIAAQMRVVAFEGRDTISALYRFDIGVLTPAGATIDIQAALGQRATFLLEGAEPDPQRYMGILRRVELVHAWNEHSLYRLTLVPEVSDLSLTRHSSVMVGMTAPQIWEQMIGAGDALPADYLQLSLSGDYAEREHVCQYKESNLNFVCRELEREGAYFFFEHRDDAGSERMLVVDAKSHHQPSQSTPVRYVPLTEDAAMNGEALDRFAMRAASQARDVTTHDFDYLNPSLDVVGGPVAVAQDGGGGQRHYGDGVRTPAEARRLSTVRAEAQIAERVRYVGDGRVYNLRAGYTFEVAEHPHDALNQRYLAVEVRHRGNDGADEDTLQRLRMPHVGQAPYRASVEAIAADVQYRHPRRTQAPRIDSIERGFVDGPADSDYAQIDEHGRYKVAIHFDEMKREPAAGNGSTWIRMLQPHGGDTEGFHFPLRKGTEVMLAFLGGDPDRPLIVGTAPNAHTPSPVTESNATQNVIQTGGKTRIEIEDEDGRQYIDISTPPADTYLHLGMPHGEHGGYIVEHTGGNQVVAIGGDRAIDVGGNQKEHVVGDVLENYDATRTTFVDSNRALTVGGDDSIYVVGKHKDVVDGDITRNYGANVNTVITGTNDHAVLSSETKTVIGTQDVITGARTDTINGTLEQNVLGPANITCTGFNVTTLGGFRQVTNADWFKFTAGVTVAVHAGIKTSIQLGLKADITVVASVSAILGLETKIRAGGILELIAAKKCSFVAGARVDQAAVAYERSPMWIRAGAGTGIVGTTAFRGMVHIL